jgi:hypothetical protein
MKTIRLAQTFVLMAALVLGAGLSAMASTVNLQFTWTGSYYESGYSAAYIQSDDAIGIYAFNQWGTVNNQVPNSLDSVCLSPAGLLDGGAYTYNIEAFSVATPGIYPSAWAVGGGGQQWGINNAAYLWNRYGKFIVNNTGNVGYQSQRAAALEFAIWTALYNSTGYGQLGANNWVAPTGQMGSGINSTFAWYDTYINALTTSGITGPQFTGNVLEGTGAVTGGAGSGQSQEFFLLGTPVPEPTTMVVGALLLLPFGASTVRMFRKSRTA